MDVYDFKMTHIARNVLWTCTRNFVKHRWMFSSLKCAGCTLDENLDKIFFGILFLLCKIINLN